METILKYEMKGIGNTDFHIPTGGKIVSVQMQRETICLWCLCDLSKRNESRSFTIFGTGHEIPPGHEYCGTVQSGPFVWHVMEVK